MKVTCWLGIGAPLGAHHWENAIEDVACDEERVSMKYGLRFIAVKEAHGVQPRIGLIERSFGFFRSAPKNPRVKWSLH